MDEPSPREASKSGQAGRWYLFGGLGVLAVAFVVICFNVFLKPSHHKSNSDSPADLFPLPPISESPFLNANLKVDYVGSESCRECHLEHDTAFRHTSMGRSMSAVDLSREPPDGAFDHPLSKRRYEVRRREGQLWHRELLLVDEPPEVVLSEFPVKHVVGSGNHSLTYLVETDGFLVESPITWYASRKAWGMSPGYDVPDHASFVRAIGEGCLTCHASRAEAVQGSQHRMNILEAAIGCERCHGPGAMHVKQHRQRSAGRTKSSRDGEVDHTIVNPDHLSRELAEAICQQCHLRSSATIPQRGRNLSDFRPGLPLQDLRLDYWLDEPDKPMTVVGHVEQLHLSRCYQKSGTLSCLTCHRPHDLHGTANLPKRNDTCLSCHQPDQCRVDDSQRQQLSPGNDCIHCHMPRSDTEIPHLTFTHHRIGVHSTPVKPSSTPEPRQRRPGVLRPFFDASRVSSIEQLRGLGLAYLETSNRESDAVLADEYRNRALTHLSQARTLGLRDPMLDTSLARVRFFLDLGDYQSLAENALGQSDVTGPDRCDCLFLIADSLLQAGRYEQAVATLHQLTALRRQHMDWMMLADCEQKLGHESAHKAALLAAVRINPRLWKGHRRLAEHFRQAGDPEQADWHQRRAVP